MLISLFELSYPSFVSQAIDPHVRCDDIRNYVTILQEWVYTATYFRSIEAIDEKIYTFIDYLRNVTLKANEDFDTDGTLYNLKFKVVESLEHFGNWGELEIYQKTFPAKFQRVPARKLTLSNLFFLPSSFENSLAKKIFPIPIKLFRSCSFRKVRKV